METIKVLVVEDDLVIAKVINRALTGLEYLITAIVPSGEKAIESINEDPPDVVLMDILLEGDLDGIDTAKIISEQYEIPVIYLTQYSDENKISRAQFTEPFGYILKPIQERELHANIQISVYKSRMEKKIRQNEQRMKTILERSPLAVGICTADGKWTFINQALVRVFELPAIDPATAPNFKTFFEETNEFDALIEKIKTMGNVQSNIFLLRTVRGNQLIIRLSASEISDGAPSYEFFIEDITKQHLASELVRRSEAKFNSIFHSPTQPFLLIDRNGAIAAHNLASQNLSLELYDKELSDNSPLESLFPGIMDDVFNFRGVNGNLVPIILEKIVRDKLSAARWYELTFTPIPVAVGPIQTFALAVKEITERKEYERNLEHYILQLEQQHKVLEKQSQELSALNMKLIKSEQDLKALNANKDKFFSIIAHDLRNPFNTLLGFSEYLMEDIDILDNATIKSISTDLYKAAKGVLGLLDNLLQWARIQTGRIDFDPEDCKLLDLVNVMTKLYGPAAAKKMIHLYFEVPIGVVVFADKNMLSSILQNLISNAIKFTERNGWVKLTYHFENDNHIIIVSDNGIGLTADQLAGLFKIEETVSVRGTDNEIGSGLGLILTKEFVEKHGGKLTVESEYQKGAAFVIKLPVQTT